MSEKDAAAWIAERRLAGKTLADMPAAIKPPTEAAAYRIQADVQARLVAAGWGPRLGWKVGVTTRQMRAALSLESPIGGTILAGGQRENGASLAAGDYVRIGIECEMAFVLGAPLGGTTTVGVAAAGAAVAELRPAIELVDDRYGGDYRGFGVPSIVADDAFHAGFALGPAVPNWRQLDLGALHGVTRANGAVKFEGYGRDVQGHPLASLAWMANRLSALGSRMEAGDIVLTGSLPVVYWAAPGERVEIEIERLGRLYLNVT